MSARLTWGMIAMMLVVCCAAWIYRVAQHPLPDEGEDWLGAAGG